MSNILDYIEWRGDVPLSVSSFNEVDALILSQLSYMDMGGLASGDFRHRVTLSVVAEKFKASSDYERRSNMGAVINSLSVQLLDAAGLSRRFGNMEVCGYRNDIDEERGEQFCAVTFLTSFTHAFIAYRGTDDTIVGWKEDFNLAVLDTVPSQSSALLYLTEAMSTLRHRHFDIGGHSKGGNLAVYAAAMLEGKARHRLNAVYNMDGPGFTESRLASPQFQAVLPLLKQYYPKFSIVGMIFSHAGDINIVESDAALLMQHDPFSWVLGPHGFTKAEALEKGSTAFHSTVNTWLSSVNENSRAAFVETLFSVIEATGSKTNSELETSWLTSTPRIIKALAAIDSATREEVLRTVQALFRAAAINIPLPKWPFSST